jgi:hypothetical protein
VALNAPAVTSQTPETPAGEAVIAPAVVAFAFDILIITQILVLQQTGSGTEDLILPLVNY